MDTKDLLYDWIESKRRSLIDDVIKWANINTFSENVQGLNTLHHLVADRVASFADRVDRIEVSSIERIDPRGLKNNVPIAPCLYAEVRPTAPIQLFFGGHLDTVFMPESGFISASLKNDGTIHGPGVADMKGGIAVMLTALDAFEKSDAAKNVGVRILINTDEEIGSPASTPLLLEKAKGCDFAFLFEPTFCDGSFVSSRKGSANLAITIRGKSAHAGRDFYKGKSAIATLSKILSSFSPLNDPARETTVNIGYIYGGGAVNVVPELAMCRLNIRAENEEKIEKAKRAIEQIVKEQSAADQVKGQVVLENLRPPKKFDRATENLFQLLKETARELNQEFTWRPSGGVCDGNTIASLGIPTADTCGVIGGGIHSHQEYLIADSLGDKAHWMALALTKIAKGQL